LLKTIKKKYKQNKNNYSDQSIGLNVVDVLAMETQFLTSPTDAADDAAGDGVAESEGAAHGDHPLPRTQVGRLPHPQGR
jgi:hypothetical protein